VRALQKGSLVILSTVFSFEEIGRALNSPERNRGAEAWNYLGELAEMLLDIICSDIPTMIFHFLKSVVECLF
jgi:hypothetical protein